MSTAAVPAGGVARESVGDYVRRWWSGVRGGELGSLPIIVGLLEGAALVP